MNQNSKIEAKKINNPKDQYAGLNDDISNLYKKFDNNLQHYHEIHFANTTSLIRQKWPLLKEIEAERNQ